MRSGLLWVCLGLAMLVSCSDLSRHDEIRDHFIVSPYTVMSGQHVFLKFQWNRMATLNVNGRDVNASSLELSTVDLGPYECGKALSFSIEEKGTSAIAYSHSLPIVPCDPSRPLVLGFVSDFHGFKSNLDDIRTLFSPEWQYGRTHLTLHGGDVVHMGGDASEWAHFFEAVSPFVGTSPWVATLGNHEFREHASMEGNVTIPALAARYLRGETRDHDHFILEFPQARIFIFNSNFSRMASADVAHQWAMVEAEIKRAHADRKPLILVLHHPIWTSHVFKKKHFETKVLQEKLVPLLEAYRVPLILSGHVHLYERSEKQSSHYVTAGAFAWYKMPSVPGNPYLKASKSFSTTYTWIQITSTAIQLKTFTPSRVVVDEVEIPLTFGN